MSIGQLITLSGVDCSGKSTQLELLTDAYASAGHRVKQIWFRPGYSDEMDLLRKVVRKASPSVMPTHTESTARERVFAKSGVSESWVAMALLDSFLQCACKVRIYLAQGYIVICDRFLTDAEMDLRLRFPHLQSIYKPSLWALKALAPTPAHSILLNLPFDIVENRVEKKNEPFPDPPEVRFDRWKAYQGFATNGQFETIDAAQSITEGFTDIRQLTQS